jgi:hypothetical protein
MCPVREDLQTYIVPTIQATEQDGGSEIDRFDKEGFT